MRTPKYIIEHFLIENGYLLNDCELKLNSSSESVKLSTAMKLLNIKEIQFEKIPFIADKLAHLDYKYYLVFFEIHYTNYSDSYWLNLEKFRKLAKQALTIIMNSKLITEHKDKYSKFAQGLSHIHQKSEHYESTSQPSESFSMDDLLASTLNVGPKKGGVEPGFMAEHRSDIVEWAVNLCEGDEEKLITFIDKYNGDFELIREEYRNNALIEYMYKFDYQTKDKKLPDTPGETKVYLTAEDVQRTSNVQKTYNNWGKFAGEAITAIYVYSKESTAFQINKEAIQETLSNDIASMFMLVQKQKIFRTTYSNGAFKIMARAAMIKKAEQLGDKNSRPLQGGDDDTNNYRGRTLIMARNGITSLTDTSIINAPALLAPLLVTGDYDKIGSQGQNLLITLNSINKKTGEKTWNIVGIDFGHTFRGENPLLEKKLILSDGRFRQPTFNHPFKNFSALTDGSVSNKMQGVFTIAKARGGIKISDAVVESYGSQFAECIKQIPTGEGAVVCDNYIDTADTLSELNYDNQYECGMISDAINQYKKCMHSNMDKMLAVFKDNLQYPAKIIDLADHLNKRCATLQNKATLRSHNGKHGLNHLVIAENYLKTWTIKFNIENNQYTLSCPFTNTELNTIKPGFQKNRSANMSLQFIDDKLCLSFHKIHLDEICELFDETQLQHEYYNKDFESIQTGKIELRLQDLVKAPWFKEKNIEMDLSLNPVNKKQYRITLHVTENKTLSETLSQLIAKQFNLPLKNNALILDFDSDAQALLQIIHDLEAIQNNYELELELKKKIQIKPVIEIKPIPIIEVQPELEINSEYIDDKECKIISNNQNNIIYEEQLIIHDPIPLTIEEQNDSVIIDITQTTPSILTDSFIMVGTNDNPLTLFKSALLALIELHENDCNNSYSLYTIGKNVLSYLWTPSITSTQTFIPLLKKYIQNMEPNNTEEIIKTLLILQESVKEMKNRPEKEMETINLALECGYQVLNENLLYDSKQVVNSNFSNYK